MFNRFSNVDFHIFKITGFQRQFSQVGYQCSFFFSYQIYICENFKKFVKNLEKEYF
jgi:hypothetical protein